jgi:hypothetical protein
MTRCKVVCQSVSKQRGWAGAEFIYSAVFTPVTDDGTEDNKKFFAATPTGRLELGVIREDHFQPGKSYYVDFTEA